MQSKAIWYVEENKYNRLIDTISSVLVLIVVYVLAIHCFQVAVIPSGSMEPTLQVREVCLVLYTDDAKRGDIITFVPPHDPSTLYVKRLIAVGGDSVAVHDGTVFVNGKALDEPYIKEPPEYELDEFYVPEGNYFVLGDNRNNSADSHVIGFIPAENLVGHVLVHTDLLSKLYSKREAPVL